MDNLKSENKATDLVRYYYSPHICFKGMGDERAVALTFTILVQFLTSRYLLQRMLFTAILKVERKSKLTNLLLLILTLSWV